MFRSEVPRLKNKNNFLYLMALLSGFVASYFGLLWVFIAAFVVLIYLIVTGKPAEEEKYNPVKEHYQHQRHQLVTLLGFAFVLGAILAFVVRYFL